MAQPQPSYTPTEYLEIERQAPSRSEYLDGQIFAMAGASRRHNLITGNIITSWNHQLLDRPCEVYPSDMRIKVVATGLYTYPDVSVVCEPPELEDSKLDTLLNPKVLVEVLSKSTADYDRGAKFEHYRTIPSLQEVLFVAQERVHIVHCQRQGDDSWLLRETRDPAARLFLSSIEAELLASDIYRKVQFDAGPELVANRP